MPYFARKRFWLKGINLRFLMMSERQAAVHPDSGIQDLAFPFSGSRLK
jgi:hypothetical protein